MVKRLYFYHKRGVLVEKIFPDDQWQKNEVKMLDDYFMEHILSELVFPVQVFFSNFFCQTFIIIRSVYLKPIFL